MRPFSMMYSFSEGGKTPSGGAGEMLVAIHPKFTVKIEYQ